MWNGVKSDYHVLFIALIHIYEHITMCTHVGSIQWVAIRFLTNGHFDHINDIFMKFHYKNERKREKKMSRKKEIIRIKTNCSFTIINYFVDIFFFFYKWKFVCIYYHFIVYELSGDGVDLSQILCISLSWNRNDVISINVSIILSADEPNLMWFRYDGAHICRGGCMDWTIMMVIWHKTNLRLLLRQLDYPSNKLIRILCVWLPILMGKPSRN